MAYCPDNCTCGRHKFSISVALARSARMLGHKHSSETIARISASRTGQRVERPRASQGNFNFSGSWAGTHYSKVLIPVGFEREKLVWWGKGRYECYKLDFAELKLKINVELDGPTHFCTLLEDQVRDARLRAAGWLVIRIRHA